MLLLSNSLHCRGQKERERRRERRRKIDNIKKEEKNNTGLLEFWKWRENNQIIRCQLKYSRPRGKKGRERVGRFFCSKSSAVQLFQHHPNLFFFCCLHLTVVSRFACVLSSPSLALPLTAIACHSLTFIYFPCATASKRID